VLAAAMLLPLQVALSQEISYEEIVRGNLKKMTKDSGTFDLYDAQAGKVRNLRLLEILPDVRMEGEAAFVPSRFRDIASGDIVMVEVRVAKVSTGTYDSKWTIKSVEQAESGEPKKENYTDAEIQQAMKDYIEKQSKFTGYVMLFDQKTESMRKLELVELKAEVRRFGILGISTAEFKDVGSQEHVTIDIHVKNNDGKLEVDSLKIKKIRK
jgi:hypothetical protein